MIMKATEACGRAVSVLVVDDELALVRMHGRALARAGYDVVTATDGVQARELIEQGGFAAVLSDVWMPGVDGFELLRAARRGDPTMSVVLLTCAPTAEGAEAAAANGALMYLAKPFEALSLLQVMSYACHVRSARPGQGGRRHAPPSDRAGQPRPGGVRRPLRERAGVAVHDVPAHRAATEPGGRRRPGAPSQRRADHDPGAVHPRGRRAPPARPRAGGAVRDWVAAAVSALPSPTCMFVNLHPHDFTDESLFSPRLPLSRVAHRVVLELTERASLDDVPDLLGRSTRLRRLGFRIAIDDLGAGYASLTTFAQVHPEVVKLDMALIRDVHLDPMKRTLVDTLLTMNRRLGLCVVSEGVETAAERDVLDELGCELMQGYLFGRPEKTFPTGAAGLAPGSLHWGWSRSRREITTAPDVKAGPSSRRACSR